MFCGKCGTDNPNDNQFCYSCGAPLLGAPKKEKGSKALVITIVSLLVLILAVAAVLVFVVIKPFKSKETPKSLVEKYMTSLKNGDAKGMKDCFLPEFYDYQDLSSIHKNMVNEINKGFDYEFDYTLDDYEKLTGSEFEEFKKEAPNYINIKSSKIQEYGKIEAEVRDNLSDSPTSLEFSIIKYDGKYYLAIDPMYNTMSRGPISNTSTQYEMKIADPEDY